MFISSLLAAFSLFSTLIYMFIGIYIFKQNKKCNIHKTFLILCISYATWSFAYAFAYLANNDKTFSFWNKISALGWCSFSAITLYLVLLLTETKIVSKRILKILIFLPSVIFFYMAVFLFGYNINTSTVISNIFYIGDFLYNFTYLLSSIILLLIWGKRTSSLRIKKQSKILIISSITPFILNLITQSILPIIGVSTVPLMGQLYAVVMIIGTYIVILKYKFLRISEEYIFQEIMLKMFDMAILLDENGKIIKVNKKTLILLGYDEKELLHQSTDFIIEQCDINKMCKNKMWITDKTYNDVTVVKKNKEKIPVNISCSPIFDSKINDFLGVILVIQDITLVHELQRKNAELQERAIRDSLTMLYNHQYSIELLKKEIEKVQNNVHEKNLSVMMLDIDYFKKINDIFGHQFGDYVLKIVSDVLIKNIDINGYVGRYGGEEFIIILPDTDLNIACAIGEKIRTEISGYNFNADYVITISIGIKQYRDESVEVLIKNADKLLYVAKQKGRNRLEALY